MKNIYRTISFKLISFLIVFSISLVVFAPRGFSKTSDSVSKLFDAKGMIIDISAGQGYIYMNDRGFRITPKTLYYTSPQKRISLKDFNEGDNAGIILDQEDGSIKVLWLIEKK